MLEYVDYVNEISNELESTLFDNDDENKIFNSNKGNRIYFNEFDDCERKSSANVFRNKVIVFVKTLNGKPIPIDITQNISIIELKKKIQNEIELSTNDYYLQYHGQYLNDKRTLKHYEISNKSQINVIKKLRGGVQIFGKTIEGKSVAIEIFKNEKVIDLKMKIQEKTGMQTNEQKLIYNGKNLEDDKLLEEYEVVEKSVINIVQRRVGNSISILVKMLDGRTVNVEVSKHDRVVDLKEKIKEKVGILVEEQKLVYQGKLLEDEIELDKYEIVDKCVVNLIVRLKGGTKAYRH